MIALKCKMCGGDLTIEENQSVCECEYCGSKQTVPTVDDEKVVKLYQRANRLRIANEFDKAATVYEGIIEEDDAQAEAYWGLLLCKYGIEYVDDPATGDKIPTCHRSSFESIMEDEDFELVMENADSLSKSVYREQAKQIEEIRKAIIEVSGKEAPYDIFICYKETDENGERTIDSVLAQDTYDVLTGKGYRVFFSRISLEDKLGMEYEPYIFAALNSAKVMLAFGTNYDYYNAVWVKNEWSRYLKLMAKDKEKHLIPCYKDIDAYDMPKEFAKLQAQDMGKVGAIQDLLRGIEKLTGQKDKQMQTQNSQFNDAGRQSVSGGGTNAEVLIQRGYLALEDKEWEKADEFFENALNYNAQCVDAYIGKLLVEFEITSKDKLAEMQKRFDTSKNYSKAVKFADDALKAELKKDLDSIDENIENNRKSEIYQKAVEFKNDKDFESAIASFSEIIGYKDVHEQLDECKELASKEKEKSAEIDKKIDDIAETLKKHDSVSLADDIRSKIKAKESAIKSLKRKSDELQNIAKTLPSLEAEDSKLKTELDNLENEINILNQELNGLGFFAGKRKKEIAIEIEKLLILKKQTEDAIGENAGKMKNYNLASINSKITENANETKKTKNELNDLSKQLDDELNKSSDKLSYDDAMKLLKDKAFLSAFRKKYPVLEFKLMLRNDIKVGNTVTLGKYKKENIEWKVLKGEGNKYLLISSKLLAGKYYDDNYCVEDPSWEKSTLRKWLNDDFINEAFSDDEKNMIALTDVIVKPRYSTASSTKDKVFLLNVDEVSKYYADDNERQCSSADSINKGWSRELDKGNCEWWLLTADDFVTDEGKIEEVECLDMKIGVRPALWIDLEF